MRLEIRNLCKQYDRELALDHVNMVLENGIYGILGPNGAGKSTLMNILSLLLKPTQGEVYYNQADIRKMGSSYLKCIGYMPQINCLYDDFTLQENLLYIASLKGMAKHGLDAVIQHLAEEVELQDVLYKKIRSFSGGMKQRAMFAQSLLGNPSILILDEPTAGLDPQKRIELRNLIARMSRERIVLIATHVVSDIEFIANQIILLKKGKLLLKATPQELLRSVQQNVMEIQVTETELNNLQKKYQISNLHYEQNALFARLITHDASSLSGCRVQPDLNDVYLYYFGSGA